METKTSCTATGIKTSSNSCDVPTKKSILYIEDNSTNRELVRYIIDMRPNLVYLEAENGKEGLDFAQRHQPDLIFLDIHLPDMDGFTVLSHLAQAPETSDIPVIALTGNASAIDIPTGLAAGFKEILPKPIDIKKFFNVLDTILGS